MKSDLEESQARERVRDILSNLRSSYKSLFGIELPRDHLLMFVEGKIEDLKHEMIKETISHLFNKYNFNPIDLFRAAIILREEERPVPSISPSVEQAESPKAKRGRPRLLK